ncbi:unnamed protein product [Rotaria socialis]|uniref:Uncharacterized protein n=1 Tax=Rotaria socialis TaxID=392032 RepID=A0A818A6H7_9BILA|nr:unnamed protein product [Rotaria socialis]CAF3401240.1 unnamed protein product [Rotaria socialis]CAF3597758.1 unnamed protein product [Rotaria socialis]CAF3764760.1 unnamed protein product [Rotaria socialis]CAF4219600.1 unnamed protein product [Rotaria socialis]
MFNVCERPLTVNNEGYPSGSEGLTNCEVENEFLYASGTLPCHRDTNCIEITVKIGAAEIVDNIQLSIG